MSREPMQKQFHFHGWACGYAVGRRRYARGEGLGAAQQCVCQAAISRAGSTLTPSGSAGLDSTRTAARSAASAASPAST